MIGDKIINKDIEIKDFLISFIFVLEFGHILNTILGYSNYKIVDYSLSPPS